MMFSVFLHIYSSFGFDSINYSLFMLYLFANEQNTKKKNIKNGVELYVIPEDNKNESV